MANVCIAAASSKDCRAVAQIHVDAWRMAYAGIVPSKYLAALSVDQREAMSRTAVGAELAQKPRAFLFVGGEPTPRISGVLR
jgi:hypothetical protein